MNLTKKVLLEKATKWEITIPASWTKPKIREALLDAFAQRRQLTLRRVEKQQQIALRRLEIDAWSHKLSEIEIPWNYLTREQWTILGVTIPADERVSYWVGETEYFDRGCHKSELPTRPLAELKALAKGYHVIELLAQANKMTKLFDHGKILYSIKDKILKNQEGILTDGKISRQEEYKTLYEHLFQVDGREYSFHSYSRPKIVSGYLRQEGVNFGRRITDIHRWIFSYDELVALLNDFVASFQNEAADKVDTLISHFEVSDWQLSLLIKECPGLLARIVQDNKEAAKRLYLKYLEKR